MMSPAEVMAATIFGITLGTAIFHGALYIGKLTNRVSRHDDRLALHDTRLKGHDLDINELRNKHDGR